MKELVAEPTVFFTTESGELKAVVEVVSTPARIQRGLMHRQHLAPDRGMLFVFSSDRVRTFWMKNTLIPLDMLFIDADLRIAGIVENTEPLTLTQRTVGIATRYVLELNAGWASKHDVKPGMLVRFENMPVIENAPL